LRSSPRSNAYCLTRNLTLHSSRTPLCEAYLHFQPNHHFPNFPSPKRPDTQSMRFKRQIPGEAISTCLIFFGRSSFSSILPREFDVREVYSASLLSSQWIPSRSCLSQLISVLLRGSLIFVSRRWPGRPGSRNRRSLGWGMPRRYSRHQDDDHLLPWVGIPGGAQATVPAVPTGYCGNVVAPGDHRDTESPAMAV